MNKIFKLFSVSQKKFFIILVMSLLVFLILEFLFFFSLQPIINYFLNNPNTRLFNFLSLLDFYPKLSLSNLIFLFIFFFLLRSIFSIIAIFLRSKFVKSINDDFSKRIYSNYLNQNFEFFIQHDSSILISNLINEVGNFSYKVLDGLLIIITEFFLVLAILIFLLINYFKATIFLTVVISFFFIFLFSFFKKKYKKLGEQKVVYDSYKIKDLQKSFYVIQNIKLDHLENLFLERFEKNTQISSSSHS